MNTRRENTIGIVGGMGPEACVNLFNSITSLTDAATDQEHLSVILMSFPKHITDRTAFLEGNTDINPANVVAKIIKRLENAGANIIGMACNTIHAPEIFDVILGELDAMKSKVCLVHMPLATCQLIKKKYPLVNRVGLMTTNGTYRARIYENILSNLGYEVVVPDFTFQNNIIHKMIYDSHLGVKANPFKITSEVKSWMNESIAFFKKNKADAIILGCTELSLIPVEDEDLIIVDSTKAMALALIAMATDFTVVKTNARASKISRDY